MAVLRIGSEIPKTVAVLLGTRNESQAVDVLKLILILQAAAVLWMDMNIIHIYCGCPQERHRGQIMAVLRIEIET